MEHIVEVDGEAFAGQGVVPLFVDGFPLDVHHVIVLEQPLADAEVVFHFLLPSIDLVTMECWITSPSSVPMRSISLAMRSDLEEAREVVFQRDVELRAARVSLASYRRGTRNWRSTRRESCRSVPTIVR